MRQDKIYIYGRHAVLEALRNAPEAVGKIYLEKIDKEIEAIAGRVKVPIEKLSPNDLAARTERGVKHQGVIARIALHNLVRSYADFIKNLKISPNTALAILGEIQDPQNVGAIIRSAAGLGLAGIIMPEHHQAPVSGAVVKVSAGMAFRIPLVSVGNINDTIRDLKKHGFWIYGLAGEAAQPIMAEKFDTPTVFILGNEAEGIREKTRELCDVLIKIPTHPKCESLNVAASAAITFYTWSGHHPNVLTTPRQD